MVQILIFYWEISISVIKLKYLIPLACQSVHSKTLLRCYKICTSFFHYNIHQFDIIPNKIIKRFNYSVILNYTAAKVTQKIKIHPHNPRHSNRRDPRDPWRHHPNFHRWTGNSAFLWRHGCSCLNLRAKKSRLPRPMKWRLDRIGCQGDRWWCHQLVLWRQAGLRRC